MVTASFRYYDKGLFPPSGLVSLTPPSLVANAPEHGVGR
ncbi:effector protein Tle3 domain-containing protein [Pseudomonas putida]